MMKIKYIEQRKEDYRVKLSTLHPGDFFQRREGDDSDISMVVRGYRPDLNNFDVSVFNIREECINIYDYKEPVYKLMAELTVWPDY